MWEFDTVDFAPLNVSTYERIGPSLAFVTENWAMVTPTYDYTSGRTNWSSLDAPVFLSATGLRFISQKFSTDVAIVNTFVDGTYIPIPWIDISWYFDLNVD